MKKLILAATTASALVSPNDLNYYEGVLLVDDFASCVRARVNHIEGDSLFVFGKDGAIGGIDLTDALPVVGAIRQDDQTPAEAEADLMESCLWGQTIEEVIVSFPAKIKKLVACQIRDAEAYVMPMNQDWFYEQDGLIPFSLQHFKSYVRNHPWEPDFPPAFSLQLTESQHINHTLFYSSAEDFSNKFQQGYNEGVFSFSAALCEQEPSSSEPLVGVGILERAN